MHGFNRIYGNGAGGFGFVRVIRTLLTRDLPQIIPKVTLLVQRRLAELRSKHTATDGMAIHNTVSVDISLRLYRLVECPCIRHGS